MQLPQCFDAPWLDLEHLARGLSAFLYACGIIPGHAQRPCSTWRHAVLCCAMMCPCCAVWQGMAGNIIHAIATTNAIVGGIIVSEALKVLAGEQ